MRDLDLLLSLVRPGAAAEAREQLLSEGVLVAVSEGDEARLPLLHVAREAEVHLIAFVGEAGLDSVVVRRVMP